MIYYDIDELAKITGMKKEYLRYLCCQRRIPHFKKGNLLLVSETQLAYAKEYSIRFHNRQKERGKNLTKNYD